MKWHILFVLGLFSAYTFSQNQSANQVSKDTTVYETADEDPIFPGGHFAVFDSVAVYVNTDSIFKDRNIDGEIKVEFIVETDGKTHGFKVIKSLDPVFDVAFVGMLMKMPAWTPAVLRNEKVRFKKVLSLKFSHKSY